MEERDNRVHSVFFTETDTFKHMNIIPEEFELPLFINKRIPIITHIDIKWCRFLEHQMALYRKMYHNKSKVILHPQFEKPKHFGCDEQVVRDRPDTERDWLLAPNRYNIIGHRVADIINKSTGKKGPYQCFTGERTEATLMGYFKPKPFYGPLVNDFYDKPSEIDKLNHSRNYFRYKMRKGNRKNQRPTLRLMLQDLSLCYRDPSEPGPAHYYPKNFCLETYISKKVVAKKFWTNRFYPMTTVPVSDHIKVYYESLKPAPGRYTPDDVSCPCQIKICKKKTSRKNRKCACDLGKYRNIPGHGFTWIFESKVMRIVGKSTYVSKKSEKHLPIFDIAKYLRMITKPRRNEQFSYLKNYEAIYFRPCKIRFNTTERPKRRTKLRVNKRICFMSSIPRFPDVVQSSFVVPKKKIEIPHYICKNPSPVWPKPGETPLSAFPYHLLPPRAKRKEKIGCFKPLPPPKVFPDEGKKGFKDIHLYYKPYKIEDFLKKRRYRNSETIGDGGSGIVSGDRKHSSAVEIDGTNSSQTE